MVKRLILFGIACLLFTGCAKVTKTQESSESKDKVEVKETSQSESLNDKRSLTFNEYMAVFKKEGTIDQAYEKLKINLDISQQPVEELIHKYSWKSEGGGIYNFDESGEVGVITLDGRVENFGKYNILNDDFYIEPSQEIVNYANVIKDHKFVIDPHKIVLSSGEFKEHKLVYYPMKKINISSSEKSSSN